MGHPTKKNIKDTLAMGHHTKKNIKDTLEMRHPTKKEKTKDTLEKKIMDTL